MKTIERATEAVVGRDCGFAAIAVLAAMAQTTASSDPQRAIRMGAALSLLLCGTLVIRAIRAARRSYVHADVYAILRQERGRAHSTERLVVRSLRQTYLRFALHAAYASAAFSGLSLFGPPIL